MQVLTRPVQTIYSSLHLQVWIIASRYSVGEQFAGRDCSFRQSGGLGMSCHSWEDMDD